MSFIHLIDFILLIGVFFASEMAENLTGYGQWRHQDFKLGGNCGAKVFTGGAMQKFDAIRVTVPFDAICVLFINIGFCMFNKLIFFATELSFVFLK